MRKSLAVNYDHGVRYRALCDSNNSGSGHLIDLPSFVIKNGNVGVVFDQAAGVANVDSRFTLVTCQHPHLDIGAAQLVDCLWNALLELVFDGSRSTKIEVLFNHVTGFFYQPRAVHKAGGSLKVPFLPRLVLFFCQVAVTVEKGSKTLGSKVVDVLEASLDYSRLVTCQIFVDHGFHNLQLHRTPRRRCYRRKSAK